MASIGLHRPHRAFARVVLVIAAVLIGIALPVGCGKKGPPRLPDVEAPAGVADLKAALEGEEIVLTWTGLAAAGYSIYRSAEPEDEKPCEGCPILFKRVGKVPMAGEKNTPQNCEYRENWMPATRYHFKVVPYDDQGQLGSDSNIVAISTD